METYTLIPIPPLRGLLKNIWVVRNGAFPALEKMIPFGCMDLVYVERGGLVYHNQEQKHFSRNSIFLTGQVTKPYWFEYEANTTIVGFGFYPHTAHLFTSVPAFRLTDQIIHFSDLSRTQSGLDFLERQLPLTDKITLLQSWFLRKLQDDKVSMKKQQYLQYLLRETFSKRGNMDFRQERLALGISQRYTQQLFKEYIGVNPHLYSKVVRFLNTIDQFQGANSSLTELALNSGYYDQSHFIRDFKRFTGLSPKQYFKEPPRLLEQFTSNETSSLLYNSIPEN